MEIINQITNIIVKNVKDGESIRSLAKKIGFAYSAVYKRVMILKNYDVIYLVEKGNKNIIKVNKNEIYRKFIELNKAVSIIEKDRIFWDIVRKIRLKIRFTKNTAVVIWTHGGYITGDFLDKVYFLEVNCKYLSQFEEVLEKHGIAYSEDRISSKRPLICITPSSKKFEIEYKDNLPVIPLNELVDWCKSLYLDNILEQLSSIYNLKLKAKYAEIKTNM